MKGFLSFLFSRKGFGRTSWPQFALIQLVCIAFVLLSLGDGHGVYGAVSAAVINAVLLLGSWMNYTGRWR